MLRPNLLMAALMAVALTACPSRRDDNDPDAGCVGECGDAGTDAGTDAGDEEEPTCEESPWEYDAERTFTDDECTPFTSEYTKPNNCNGFAWDGETKTVAGVEQIRYGECRDQYLRIENAVVVAIDEAYTDSSGVRRNFWIADAVDPRMGILVHFRGTDLWVDETGTEIDENAEDFERVVIGDIINVEAKLDQLPGYDSRDGRRWVLTNIFQNPTVLKQVRVELLERGSGVAPTPLEVPACFGDSNDGYNRPGQGHVGMRVHIPGPLEVTNANPVAFSNPGPLGIYARGQGPDTFFGFEITGGVLVNDYKTYDREDEERCDWRRKAIEAASEGKKVVFPNGVTGIWENYTHAPCSTADCDKNFWGGVPGTYDFCREWSSDDRGVGNYYTNVLYPQSCDDVVAIIE